MQIPGYMQVSACLSGRGSPGLHVPHLPGGEKRACEVGWRVAAPGAQRLVVGFMYLHYYDYNDCFTHGRGRRSSILEKVMSFLMDGTTDAGNVEQELVILLSCEKDE